MQLKDKIQQALLNGTFGYRTVSFIEDSSIDGHYQLCYDVTGKYGAYEVSVNSVDGKTFQIRKESEQGYGDLEGVIEIQ